MPTNARDSELISIAMPGAAPVSGLVQTVPALQVGYVMAHGAGAGMRHPFLEDVAEGLSERGIGCLRYQFPYMEQGSKRPDIPKVAHAAVRAAVEKASTLWREAALFAGGKSFGGRMTSQAQAEKPLPNVRGLIFLGFPLHPLGKPSMERARHLFDIRVPMLFLQGERDEFAKLELLQPLIKELGSLATLKLFPDADHSFHVPARTGKKDSDIKKELLDTIRDWIRQQV